MLTVVRFGFPRAAQLVLISLGIAGGVCIWSAIIFVGLLFVGSSAPNANKDTQRYAELGSFQSQLLLLPVAGQLTKESSRDKSGPITEAGVDTYLYIDREYHLASTPNYTSVDSYYRSQLGQRGWGPPPLDEGINAPSLANGISLNFERTGQYSDTLCYSVHYYAPDATLGISVGSMTAGEPCG